MSYFSRHMNPEDQPDQMEAQLLLKFGEKFHHVYTLPFYQGEYTKIEIYNHMKKEAKNREFKIKIINLTDREYDF